MKLFAQIATVIGALSMLVGFVVYSQQNAARPDGSLIIAPARATTNAVTSVAPQSAVAPASKALVPLVPRAEPKAFPPLPPTFGPELPVYDVNAVVASSSKSARLAFRGLWAIYIHSNVRLPIGPLRALIGAPELHHWHHARDRDAGNYANISPLMDLLFGTYRCPPREPESLGIDEPMPKGYVGQLLHPFRPRTTEKASQDAPEHPEARCATEPVPET